MSYCSITVVGNVGGNPERRKVGDREVVNFTVAHSRKQGRDKPEITDWYNVTCWNEKRGDIAMDYVRKGHQVMVVGELRPRSYEKNGETRTALDIDISFDGSLVLLKNNKPGDDDRVERGTKSEDRDRNRDDRDDNRGRQREPERRSSQRDRDRDLDDDIPF